MLTKVSALSRALYIFLAIVAAFVAMGGMNVALILVVLGLIAGLSMAKENYVAAASKPLGFEISRAAEGQIPTTGAHRSCSTTKRGDCHASSKIWIVSACAQKYAAGTSPPKIQRSSGYSTESCSMFPVPPPASSAATRTSRCCARQQKLRRW